MTYMLRLFAFLQAAFKQRLNRNWLFGVLINVNFPSVKGPTFLFIFVNKEMKSERWDSNSYFVLIMLMLSCYDVFFIRTKSELL